MSKKPTFDLELKIIKLYGGPVVGVDEAGRGPLAGPVVAAAVALGADHVTSGLSRKLAELNDSKALKADLRKYLYNEICEQFQVGIGIAEREQIDAENILNATLSAMRQAILALNLAHANILIDGNKAPELNFRTQTVVGGDSQCLSIAAASIIAKVTRDEIMCDLAAIYPEYGFERHKGYGTRAHLEALREHGPCSAHRRSFRPVRLALGLK